MRILLTIPLLFIAFNVHAAPTPIYFREDGGSPTTECNGRYDLPKSKDKNCAYSYNYLEVIANKDSNDVFIISQGKLALSIGPVPLWITEDKFYKNPKYYMNEVDHGRKVYFKSFNGVAKQIKMDKY